MAAPWALIRASSLGQDQQQILKVHEANELFHASKMEDVWH